MRNLGKNTQKHFGFITALVIAGLLSAACDVHGVTEPGTLASIVVTPNASIGTSSSEQMIAVGLDADGRVVTIAPVWSVAQSGGTINTTGMFTSGTVPGLFTNTIVATVGGITGRTSVTVTAGALASISIVGAPFSLGIGATQTVTAVGMDAAGNVIAFTPTWTIVAGGGTISQAGLLTAGNTIGTFNNTIQASGLGVTALATLTVTSGPVATIVVAPATANMIFNGLQQFTATGTDAAGNPVVITPVWSVAAGGGAISATGLFTAGATAGTFTNTVKATSGTASGFATVVITATPPAGVLATITVTPNPANMLVNGAQQFTAVGKDGLGNVVVITPVWSVAAGGGAISATGLFTAGATAGTFTNTVKATSGTASGFATVVITATPAAGVLATIAVTPNPANMLVNGVQQFTAVGKDGLGNIVVITPIWSVINGGGTITASGLFTAGATAGIFTNTINAASGAINGTATVNETVVVPPPGGAALGTAAPNGIMAGTAVTCVTNGTINADVSVSPGNTLTGFGPCVITGVRHLGDAVAAQGQIDLTTAYNTLAALPCPPANAIVANLGGTTKAAGVYCTASGIGVTGTLTLDGGGNPNATFVFQAGTSLTTAGNVVLINGAQAANVYWQVGSSATLGTASQWQGNILALTSITLVDNATLNGRALARNGAVTLGTNNVITLP
jgi:Ice-binding-like